MTNTDPVVIVGAARTAMGGLQGDFKDMPAAKLGAAAIKAAVERAGISAEQVEEVIMGCVLPAGQGQAPARQASLGAGLPLSAGCTTVNKMCGSGMKAAMLAHDLLVAGTADIMVAGGMESMTNAPYLLEKARAGFRLGHGEEQDRWAIISLTRAQKAITEGWFKSEITPVTVKAGKSERVIDSDEQPPKANLEKIPTLKPAFREGGTVTPANSSSISDGAAALTLMKLSKAEKLGLTPIAAIRGHATHAHQPNLFATAPIGAVQKVLAKTGWGKDQVDLYEINEAFAVVAMAAIKDLGLDEAKVNVHGGACALGHPIGASGARILVTLLAALKKYGQKRGVASLCIGGGEATAMAVELL
jgi:acetyl-CoA C-acetyltransferase